MIKDHSVKEETCCCHFMYSFQLAAGNFHMHHLTDRIVHTMTFCDTSCGVLAQRDHSNNKEETCFCHVMGYSFQLTAGNVCMHYLTDRIVHTMTFCDTSCGLLARRDHSNNKEETCCCHVMGYSFQLAAGNFCMHHPTNRIVHTMTFVIQVVEHWLKESTNWDQSTKPPYQELTLYH